MVLLLSLVAHAEPAYLRTPDLHAGQLVFGAVGDLWIVSDQGGVPRQLTTHPGDESQPAFSSDGKWVAFTGQYDGNSDVFVIPVGGGEPRRLTWNPGRDEVIGWTPDGKVLFRTGAYEPHGNYEIFTVDPAGGEPQKLPVGWAARVAMDPSGSWAIDRIGYERRTWKRYRGGQAGDLWVGDPTKNDWRPITDSAYSEGYPMWHAGRLYYLSDRGGTAEIWSVLADGTDPKRHTTDGAWDARTPSMGDDGRIAYTRAGDLHVLNPATGEDRKIEVDLEAERTLTRRRYPSSAGAYSWYTLSPDGDRLAVVVRGDLFSVPVEDGVVLPITRTSGARENFVAFGSDGKRVVYVTDESGEEAVVSADAWGRGEPKTVAAPAASGWHYWPVVSGDGKRVAWGDNTLGIYVAPADGSSPAKRVDQSDQYEITDYSWSPDGRFLAYVKADRRSYGGVFVWDAQTSEIHRISSGYTDDYGPTWDPDGRYLYYVSNRATNPVLGGRDFEVVEARNSRLMLVLLREDVKNPFADDAGIPAAEAPVVVEKKEKKKKRIKEEEPAPDPKPITIDWAGIELRQAVFPIERGNYYGLQATSGGLLWLEVPTIGLVEEGGSATLEGWSFEDEEVVTVASDVGGYEVAHKGEKMVISRQGSLYVVDAGPSQVSLDEDSRVDTSGLVVEVDPREEWRQIYFEAWREMRDFYWDASMSGLDWTAMRDQYASLLPRISTRDELRDLLGELIGELGTSHTYVWGGDYPNLGKVDWVGNGLLGADVERVGDAYKVTHLYHGDPADEVLNPLQIPGSVIKEGEYLLAIDNQPFPKDRPFLASLEAKAGVPVLLTVSANPTGKGARSVVVTPVDSEYRLRYVDWVRQTREYVAQKSGGKFGYVHLPDMGTDGLVSFETWFYPQLDKQGMVVDDRWNHGGFVSQLLINRLDRDVISFDRSRAGGVSTYPSRVLNGPFVVLLNEFAGSDGDIFPKAVQLEKLAPVIGTRSWGGVVGIRGDKPLTDGGMVTHPEYANWYPNGGWLVENHGVDPDIVVQNTPQDVAAGVDRQLDRAIEELTRLLGEQPPIVPTFGPAPSKSRDAYQSELP